MSPNGLARPLLAGAGASIAFAALWYGLRALSGQALDVLVFVAAPLIALVVRRSTTRRSLAVSVLAACLTYLTAALAFVPLLATTLEQGVLEASGEDAAAPEPGAVAYGVALPLSCITPFVMAAESPRESGPALAATLVASALAALLVRKKTGQIEPETRS